MELLKAESNGCVHGMQAYLDMLQQMDTEDAKELSIKNLIGSGIIGKDGEFTNHFRHTNE